jgi:hypothetical protein
MGKDTALEEVSGFRELFSSFPCTCSVYVGENRSHLNDNRRSITGICDQPALEPGTSGVPGMSGVKYAPLAAPNI